MGVLFGGGFAFEEGAHFADEAFACAVDGGDDAGDFAGYFVAVDEEVVFFFPRLEGGLGFAEHVEAVAVLFVGGGDALVLGAMPVDELLGVEAGGRGLGFEGGEFAEVVLAACAKGADLRGEVELGVEGDVERGGGVVFDKGSGGGGGDGGDGAADAGGEVATGVVGAPPFGEGDGVVERGEVGRGGVATEGDEAFDGASAGGGVVAVDRRVVVERVEPVATEFRGQG